MKYPPRIVMLLFIAIFFLPVFAKADNGGVENIFYYGTGVRALGMGHAYCAVADDSSAIYWNPGGMGLLQYNEIMGLHANLFYGTIYDSALFAYPTKQLGTYCIGITRVGTGDLTFRDSHNVMIDSGLSSAQWQFVLGYGLGRDWPVSFGAVIKINSLAFNQYSDANISFDTGLLLKFYGPHWNQIIRQFQVPNLAMGVNLKDFFSTPVRLGLKNESEPWNLKIGFSYFYLLKKKEDHKFLGDIDLNLNSGKSPKISIGGEYTFLQKYSLRAGFDQNIGFVLGAGGFYRNFRLDYSITFQEIGFAHRVSLLWRFGRSIDEKIQEDQRLRNLEVQKKINSALFVQESSNKLQIAKMESKFSNSMKELKQTLSEQYQKDKVAALSNAAARSRKDQALAIEKMNKQFEIEKKQLNTDLSNRFADGLKASMEQIENQYQEDMKKLKVEMSQKSLQEQIAMSNQLKIRFEQDKRSLVSTLSNKYQKDKVKAIDDVNRKNVQEKTRLTQKLLEQEKNKRQSFQNAITAFESGDFDSATTELEGLLKTDPNLTEANEYLKRVKAAKIPYANYSKETIDLIRLGQEFFDKDDIEGAIKQWKKILEKDPYNYLANQYIQAAEQKLTDLNEIKKKDQRPNGK